MSLVAFRQALAQAALDLVGAVAADTARALVMGPDPLGDARSVVVVASGGRGFWQRLEQRPGEEHPIDRAGHEAIATALPHLGAARLLPLEDRDRFDLRRLAAAAGLGVVSPHLSLLLHPTYGPWVSVRGVVVVDDALPATGPLDGFDPCGPCARPCLDACPVGAYSRAAPFDVTACARHRLRSDEAPSPPVSCASRCHARDACVIGREHAYGDEEMRHRHRAGLPMLRAWLGPSSAASARPSE